MATEENTRTAEGARPAAAIEAEGVTLLYGGSGRGVSGASLSVAPGEIYGLMGPNGSGKSTLLRVLATAVDPQEGTVRVGGADVRRDRRAARRRLGLAVDRPTHYDDLSGRANAYLFARLYGMDDEKAVRAVDDLMDYFGLAEYAEDRVKTYSYGMGKKLGLVEAMAHGPSVLVLDEPSLGLDYASQLAFVAKLRELARSGVAVVLASNAVDEVESLCERVAFLHRGRMVAEGTPHDLISRVRGVRRVRATLRTPVDYGPLQGVPGVRQVATEGRDLVVHCEDRPGMVADVVAGIVGMGGDITDLSVRRPSLADVYVELTGEALAEDEDA